MCIERNHPKISLRRQCKLLSLARSNLYYQPTVESAENLRFSMDGKGRWIDNRMIERLWRSLKYECIYLNAFETGSEARLGIGKWLAYYNAERPHSTHGILTPKEAYETK